MGVVIKVMRSLGSNSILGVWICGGDAATMEMGRKKLGPPRTAENQAQIIQYENGW